MIKRATENDSQHVLFKQVMTCWSESLHDQPDELKEFAAFTDELTVSAGLVFKGQRVVVPRDA